MLVAGGVAYALGVAATRSFTVAADVMTGIPIVAVAILVVASWPLHPRALQPVAPSRGAHPYRSWAALFGVILVWELAQYFARGSRGAHPTLSSMTDAIDRYYPLKALVFFGWLCLGALIVRKGARAPAASTAPAEAP